HARHLLPVGRGVDAQAFGVGDHRDLPGVDRRPQDRDLRVHLGVARTIVGVAVLTEYALAALLRIVIDRARKVRDGDARAFGDPLNQLDDGTLVRNWRVWPGRRSRR